MSFPLFKSLVTLAATATLTIQPTLAADKVKIGFVSTLSGPSAALGVDIRDAFMLAVKLNGGKLGGLPADVSISDDQFKPDVGKQLFERYVKRDKVDFLTGVVFSNIMLAGLPEAVDNKTIYLSPNAAPSPIAGAQCTPYFFAVSWPNDAYHEAAGQYATNLKVKSAYLLAPNYQAGKDALAGFKAQYKGAAIDEIYTQINQPDYSAEIAQMQAAKPDALYVFYPGGMGVNFVKQYQQAGMLGKVPLLSAATVDGTTLPALKDIALGVITSSPYSPDIDNPQNKKFVDDFRKKYNRFPSLYAAQSYDAAMLLNSALLKTQGKLDREPFRAALKQANFKSVAGPFKFNNNQFPIRNFYRVDVAKDSSGQAALVNKGVVLKDHADAYASQCTMN